MTGLWHKVLLILVSVRSRLIKKHTINVTALGSTLSVNIDIVIKKSESISSSNVELPNTQLEIGLGSISEINLTILIKL